MRKLATIQRITGIERIENSETLSTATVLGWQVVIRTGDFQVGDKVIFFEVDSVLPKLPEFEFLEQSNYRLKTIRMRGQLSQGLVWWTHILPANLELTEGLDVTDHLGVTKYEETIPEDMLGVSKGYHPTIVRKSGEFRVQTMPQLLQEFQGLNVAVTTKIEGETSSYILYNDQYDVCSHTHSMVDDPQCIQWQMAHKYGIRDILAKYGNIAIQGEIAGPGIFGNPLGLEELELFIFRITDLNTHKRYSPDRHLYFCIDNGLQSVPMDFIMNFNLDLEGVLALAEGTYSPSGYPREGIVLVPMGLTYSETLCDWLSMKVLNNTYLLGEWKRHRKGK